MTFNAMDPFCQQCAKLISAPQHPERFFIISKYTYEDIYRLSAGIQKAFLSTDTEETICLCAMDKGVVAAALLASMTCPVTLMIPHSFSESALRDMRKALRFSKAITDQNILFPPDVETFVIHPNRMLKTEFSAGRLRDPDCVFLKLFTGGSTGKPKIWSKTIRNMFAEAFFLSRNFGFSPADRFMATVPPIHIYGLLFSVLAPFVSYAGVLDGVFTFPQEIHRAMIEGKPTIFVSIPIHYRMLNGSGVQRETLRRAFSSAGKLDPADSKAFYKQTGLKVIEIYGSTETGGLASRCSSRGLGRFIPNDCVDWKVIADRLFVRSDFVSPEIKRDDDGFVDTGDQVEPVGVDGFKLRGRADRIVKVAGKRVDMEDVKNQIIQLENVTDAVVIATKSRTGRENEIWALVAGNIEQQALKRQIMEVLEPCAIPRRIRIVDHIPVSPTGKYDKTEIKAFFSNC